MSSRLRILQFFYSFDIEAGGGGLSKFAIELGKALDPERFEVIFGSLGFTTSPLSDRHIQALEALGYETFEATQWDITRPYQSFLQAQSFVNRWFHEHPEKLVIHSHSEYTDISALILKIQRRSMPILRTVHYGYKYEWRTKPLRRLVFTNLLYPLLYNQEIGINQFNTDRMNHRLLARLWRRQARCIYNAIPLEPFQSVDVDRSQKRA
ncbi:MAG: glycosyltransferase, partial [Chloroflexota bacterium]